MSAWEKYDAWLTAAPEPKPEICICGHASEDHYDWEMVDSKLKEHVTISPCCFEKCKCFDFAQTRLTAEDYADLHPGIFIEKENTLAANA